MSLPTVHLALRRAYLAAAESFPPADPSYKSGCSDTCRKSDERFDAAEDKNICLQCEREITASLAEFVGGGSFPTPESAEERAANTCERCGEYGTMKHGDPDDCRSPSCMADKCDAAERDR